MSLIRNICLVAVVVILIGSVLIPIVDDAKEQSVIDVIIVDGQSNAEDWAAFSSEINTLYTETPVNDIYYYGSPTAITHYSDSESVILKYGIQPMYKDGQWVIGGYGPALCNGYAAKNGHPVCYINIGVGGRSIETLVPDGVIGSWGFNIVDDALDLLKGDYDIVNMIGWIWAQGEADAELSVDTYIADFDEIQAKFSNYGAGKCYIVHTRDYYGGNANTAQNEIVESDPNVVMTCMFTEDFTEANGELRDSDPIHYSQKGRLMIAEELADVIPAKPASASDAIYGIIPIVVILSVLIATVAVFVRNREMV